MMIQRARYKSLLLLFAFTGEISLANAALPPPCDTSFSPAFSTETISDIDWDETAVRKVMHTFAYGGFASDQQIKAWADMAPSCAIQEILTFQSTNDLLSPPGNDPVYDNIQSYLTTSDGDATLAALQTFWSTDPASPAVNSTKYDLIDTSNNRLKISALQYTWIDTTNKHGVNPFRQKVGFWLTNYHMSVHMQAVENNPAIIRKMYDDVMRVLAADTSGTEVNYFANVLATGAKSPALAVQYGHKDSKYVNGQFKGNDDFAREFHQLFFGILGDATDKNTYENVTIENMARILTGMKVDKSDTYYGDIVTAQNYYHDVLNYDPTLHYPSTLPDPILSGVTISSANYPTAMDKIDAAAQISINNIESEDNLPVWIISHFADDTLSSEDDTNPKVVDIRNAWINSNKNLLHFLRSYAISNQFLQRGGFQSTPRYKYLSAFDRNMIAYNQNTVDNKESYLNTAATPKARMETQGAKAFYPAHFVFGGQTGIEAANNPDIFKEAYNANISKPYRLAGVKNNSTGWQKEWTKIVPASLADANGQYRAGDLGAWLWNRFMADGGAHYGLEERFYVAGLMAQGVNFDPGNGYTRFELDPNDANANTLAIQQLTDNENTIISIDNNINVGLAVNFITTTPFMFAQSGSDLAGGQ
ncbi:MAG TPA: DUF1800 family protein [Gammaproteobacteria bacterium]|nr:DUF1800 family protein [Gammaproteobacteria bacterium]